MFALGLVSFEVFWGTLSDNFNRERLLMLSLLSMALVLPLYTQRRLLPFFIIFQFIIGALFVMVGPTSRAMIASLSPPESLGLNMSLWSTAAALGGMTGPFLGGFIAGQLGYEYTFITGSIILVLAVVTLSASSRGRAAAEPRTGGGWLSFREQIVSVTLDRGLWMFFAVAFMIYLGMALVRSFLPIYASEVTGIGEVRLGLIFTVGVLAQLVFTPYFGRLSDKWRVENILTGLQVLTGLLFFSYLFTGAKLMVALITVGLFICFSSPSLALIMLSKTVSKSRLGVVMGVYGSFEDLGQVFGGLIYGYIWEVYQPSGIFLLAGFTSIALAVYLRLATRRGTQTL